MPFSTAAAAALTFNLICTGNLHSLNYYTGEKDEPYTSAYRIDLQKKQYCESECRIIRQIIDVQPTLIVLEEKNTSSPIEVLKITNTIDRTTGEQSSFVSSSNPRDRMSPITMVYKGRCERQPFAGFPKFDTKF